MSNKKNWWLPENLAEIESQSRQQDDFKNLEKYGDFGAYRRLLLGDKLEKTMLSKHNSLNPKAKLAYCHDLLNRNPEKVESVLDLGCGVGITTNEMGILYKNAKVIGVDISSDAIEYGIKHYLNIDFICQAVDPSNSKIGEFDIIYAFEFYPFTRTGDISIHANYLKYFMSQLKFGGSLVIHLMWEQDDSIFYNYNDLKKNFPDYIFRLADAPAEKILRILKIKTLSLAVDRIACFLLNRKRKKVIIVTKK